MLHLGTFKTMTSNPFKMGKEKKRIFDAQTTLFASTHEMEKRRSLKSIHAFIHYFPRTGLVLLLTELFFFLQHRLVRSSPSAFLLLSRPPSDQHYCYYFVCYPSPSTGHVKNVSPNPVPEPMQAIGSPWLRSPA